MNRIKKTRSPRPFGNKPGIHQKLIIIILIIELVMAGGTAVFSYVLYSQRYVSTYSAVSSQIASTAKDFCKAEDVVTLKNTVSGIYQKLSAENKAVPADSSSASDLAAYRKEYESASSSAAYQSIRQVLLELLKSNDIKYLYLGYFAPDSDSFIYLADGSTDSGFSACGDIEASDSRMVQKLRANNYSLVGYVDSFSGYGTMVTTYLPVYDENGNYICSFCADIDISYISAQRRDFLFSMVLFLLILMAPLGIAAAHLTDKHLIKPIYGLSEAISDFAAGKKDEVAQSKISSLHLRSGDEVEMLSHSLQKMETEINEYVDKVTAIAGEKERMKAEFSIATKIQMDMIPHLFPAFPERPEIDLYATMTPAREVGGDFYDFFRIDSSHIGIVIGDVSGKGVPGALFMMISKTLLKDEAMRCLSPKVVLETVNAELCENNEAEMFVTVWLGILNLSTGHLRFANAGHENPAYRRAGGSFELVSEKHGMVLGGLEGTRYNEFERMMNPGDLLFIYTDGIPEATDSHEKMYGTSRMISALNKDPDAGISGLLKNVREDVDLFVNGAPQFDDMTMLSAEYRGPQ